MPIPLKLIQALTFSVNAESGIGKGHHYAIGGVKGRKPQFSFVSVRFEDGNQLAQIVAILQLSSAASIERYLYVVQFLVAAETAGSPFTTYK